MSTSAIAVESHHRLQHELFGGYPSPCWLRDGNRILIADHFDQFGVPDDPTGRTLAELFGPENEFAFRRDDAAVLAGQPAQHRPVLGGAGWIVTLWRVWYEGRWAIAGTAVRSL